MGLEGHIRLSGDMAHERYRGYRRPGRIKGTTTAYRHVRQQPIEEQLTRKDVEEIIQRAMEQPKKPDMRVCPELFEDKKQQPATAVERALSEEKQKIVDLKAERELVELLKSQMTGAVYHDHEIMDNAPERLYDELAQYHLSFIGK